MKKYTVEFINHTSKGNEFLEFWEMSRQTFSKYDYKQILRNLFWYGARSYQYAFLTARVRCEGEDVFVIKCDTKTSRDGIYSYVSMARPREQYFPMRVMAVAV